MTARPADAVSVVLPGGRRVNGRGLRNPPPAHDLPDFGLYLTLIRPEQPWPLRWICWPDFALPLSTEEAVDAIEEVYSRAATSRVEIACGSGIGRTGTAIALLACRAGVPPERAVAWTREHYRPRAVETPWQRRWLLRAAEPDWSRR